MFGVYSRPVHISLELKGTFDSGDETSGSSGVKGLIKSRKRTVLLSANCASRFPATLSVARILAKQLTSAHLDNMAAFAASSASIGRIGK